MLYFQTEAILMQTGLILKQKMENILMFKE
jgi:hypothetical protein